ncbi:thiosulfohydrolase SoxB [Babesia caballi]|uniref:Thiosulfohydrolase SoxB n=1 Tax=Babesia caballi TaxID=5871 RepID=A0AAV4LT44_BABCB|nr:thiosulfohydrolase SoxB [Babesia caballi]
MFVLLCARRQTPAAAPPLATVESFEEEVPNAGVLRISQFAHTRLHAVHFVQLLGHVRPRPAQLVDDLRLAPGPEVGAHPAVVGPRAAEKHGQLVGVDELADARAGLRLGGDDGYLGERLGVEQRGEDLPEGREEGRGVDEEELAQQLRVVVLSDAGHGGEEGAELAVDLR